jgi:hypothetical protein
LRRSITDFKYVVLNVIHYRGHEFLWLQINLEIASLCPPRR